MNNDTPAQSYWAVTGRFFNDDEDTPFVTPLCTKDEAIEGFRQWMIDEAMEEGEDEESLRRRTDRLPSQSAASGIYVVSIFSSTAPIHHA
jgi:hypothetical protein